MPAESKTVDYQCGFFLHLFRRLGLNQKLETILDHWSEIECSQEISTVAKKCFEEQCSTLRSKLFIPDKQTIFAIDQFLFLEHVLCFAIGSIP